MKYEVIIIGAGHAGLCTSYHLARYSINHLVLERGEVGHSWTSQRWDSFRVNTPNKFNTLPDAETSEPEGFGSARSLATAMKDYVSKHKLPVITGATVTSVERVIVSGEFVVTFEFNGKTQSSVCSQLVVATGAQNVKRVSPLRAKIHSNVYQLHSSEYLHAGALPAGDVLVVGSGQSGCQIAEDLISHGRQVYLSTSIVPRCPRYYRGKDIMDWLVELGFFNRRASELPDPALINIRTPLLTGTGNGRWSLSLQNLQKAGVTLLGNLIDVSHDTAAFTNDVNNKINFADKFSSQIKKMIDDYITSQNLQMPEANIEEDDYDRCSLPNSSELTDSSMKMKGISTVLWANGFTHNFNYLKMPVFDPNGSPLHCDGISGTKGLYFLGLHWLKDRKSDILFGIKEDAQRIAAQINLVANGSL